MKKSSVAAAIAALAIAFSANAADKGSLEIRVSPSDQPAEVSIDNRFMDVTPLILPYFPAGVHTIRVKKDGKAIERRVELRPDSKLVINADFENREIGVTNKSSLGYDPHKGPTMRVMSSTDYDGGEKKPPGDKTDAAKPDQPAAAPKDDAKTGFDLPGKDPAPADLLAPKDTGADAPAADMDAAPGTAPGTAAENPGAGEPDPLGYRPCKPGEWCPEPKSKAAGPAVPPSVAERNRQKELEAERARENSPDSGADDNKKTDSTEPPKNVAVNKTPAPDATKPSAPGGVKLINRDKPADTKKPDAAKKEDTGKPAAAPCTPRPDADFCKVFGGPGDVRGALYNYYCELANHDLDKAYKMWSIGKDAGWFYESSANYCQVYDYRIKDLDTADEPNGRKKVTYKIDLLDSRGRIVETRNMEAAMLKASTGWKFTKNVRVQ